MLEDLCDKGNGQTELSSGIRRRELGPSEGQLQCQIREDRAIDPRIVQPGGDLRDQYALNFRKWRFIRYVFLLKTRPLQ
jgi:hypothetical protein